MALNRRLPGLEPLAREHDRPGPHERPAAGLRGGPRRQPAGFRLSRTATPSRADVGLLIEIAVTSLHDDLTTALEQYARASISAYWVVDVPGRRILVHTEPRVVDGRGEYARVEIYRPGQSLPLVLDGQEVARIPFDELLR